MKPEDTWIYNHALFNNNLFFNVLDIIIKYTAWIALEMKGNKCTHDSKSCILHECSFKNLFSVILIQKSSIFKFPYSSMQGKNSS